MINSAPSRKILKAQEQEDFETVETLKREYLMRRERENNYMMLATNGIDVMETSGVGGACFLQPYGTRPQRIRTLERIQCNLLSSCSNPTIGHFFDNSVNLTETSSECLR